MARAQRSRREPRSRREEAAILLPFFGVILLAPPILNLFVVGELVRGLPPTLVYLFSVWLALVGGAVLLSRAAPFHLDAKPEDHDPARPEDQG